jgi:hypothetical protein
MAKQNRTLSTDEAMRRVKLIVNLLLDDVRMAVTTHVTMQTLNETIPALGDRPTDPAYTVKAIQDALALKVAMDAARIFDVSEGRQYTVEKQDKASIPVLAALLAREDVEGVLVEEARHWSPIIAEERMAACRRAVAGFIRTAQLVQADGTEKRRAFIRIREFRTKRLAHHLFDQKPDAPPIYDDLTLLIGVATKAVKLAALGINDRNIDPQRWIKRDREQALQFCRCLIAGVDREASAG